MDEATRRLPQGCQVEQPYTEDEWRTFLACARKGFDSGEGIHREFYAKIGERRIPDLDVLHVIRMAAKLVAYEHNGKGRIAMWVEGEDLLVIATEREGLILNAFRPDDLDEYVVGLTSLRWLRR
jgi:hypothetical protein